MSFPSSQLFWTLILIDSIYYTKENVSYKKTEQYSKAITTDLSKKFHGLLGKLGEDPEREGLLKTPSRVAKAFDFLTEGYKQDPKEILSQALFSTSNDEMVLVRDIEFYSMCEHHMIPFIGIVCNFFRSRNFQCFFFAKILFSSMFFFRFVLYFFRFLKAFVWG